MKQEERERLVLVDCDYGDYVDRFRAPRQVIIRGYAHGAVLVTGSAFPTRSRRGRGAGWTGGSTRHSPHFEPAHAPVGLRPCRNAGGDR
jgi:hypothetical protein